MEKKNAIGTVITMIFAVLGVLSVGLTMSTGSTASLIVSVVSLFTYVVIIAYMLWDYKVPHGNIYKYVMLIYAFSLSASVYYYVTEGKTAVAVLLSVSMVLIGYMAGRLGKIKKNAVLMLLILVLLAVKLALNIVDFPTEAELSANNDTALAVGVRSAGCVITWIALCSGYCARFTEHKAAGEESDNK